MGPVCHRFVGLAFVVDHYFLVKPSIVDGESGESRTIPETRGGGASLFYSSPSDAEVTKPC